MIFREAWSPTAARERDHLDVTVRRRILEAIKRFCETGQGDVKAMKGCPGQYRLRVGDWRILFALDTSRGDLVVLKVAHRREVYRD